MNDTLISHVRTMLLKRWMTPTEVEIELLCHGYEPSGSNTTARIRDLRKPHYGNHTVSKRHLQGGIYEYRVMR